MKCIIKELGLLDKINVSYFCGQLKLSRSQFYNIINNEKTPRIDTAYGIVHLIWLGGLISSDEISELWVPEYLYDERYGNT